DTHVLHSFPTRRSSDLSGEQKHLTELIKQGIQHKGFSFLDVFSPCVTYNHDNTYQWFRPRVKKLEDDSAYDPANWVAAMEKSLRSEEHTSELQSPYDLV